MNFDGAGTGTMYIDVCKVYLESGGRKGGRGRGVDDNLYTFGVHEADWVIQPLLH